MKQGILNFCRCYWPTKFTRKKKISHDCAEFLREGRKEGFLLNPTNTKNLEIYSFNEEERSGIQNTDEAPNCEPGPSIRGLSSLERVGFK